MRLNADFSEPAVVIPREEDWVRSPESGVDRLMLDRIGDEVARATSIVRYAPGSSFSRHEHAKGEEFLVLEGVFSDEQGDYPTGTYVRNPPGSGHAPYSENGCRIFVKLRQFDPNDLTRIVADSTDSEAWPEGEGRFELHQYGTERVEMVRLPAARTFNVSPGPGGLEILVVNGSIEYQGTEMPAESWLRFPEDYKTELRAIEDSLLWIKSGHLPA